MFLSVTNAPGSPCRFQVLWHHIPGLYSVLSLVCWKWSWATSHIWSRCFIYSPGLLDMYIVPEVYYDCPGLYFVLSWSVTNGPGSPYRFQVLWHHIPGLYLLLSWSVTNSPGPSCIIGPGALSIVQECIVIVRPGQCFVLSWSVTNGWLTQPPLLTRTFIVHNWTLKLCLSIFWLALRLRVHVVNIVR
jgi:hypothetical protein